MAGPRVTPAMAAILVALITFAVFFPAVHNGFASTWDDNTNLIDNPHYRGFAWPQVKWMWTNHLMDHYVPLTWMTFGLDYLVWKVNPYGYHLSNVILHATNAGLFCLLALAMLRLSMPKGSGRSAGLIGAVFAALFFGLHPLRVESVAWVTERRDVLSGVFYLLALLAYLRAAGEQAKPATQRKYYWSCFGLFVAAVLSKEIAVTLPVVLLILDFYPLRRLGDAPGRWFGPSVRGVWLEKIPFFVVALADSAMTTYVAVQQDLPESLAKLGWLSRLAISDYGMAFYVLKTVAPRHLSPLYPLNTYKTDPRSAAFILSFSFVFIVSFAALALYRRDRWLLPIWLAYAVTLLPVGGLIHNGNQIAADRYTYLSCLGWALLAGAALVLCWRWAQASWVRVGALACLALGALAALAWQTRQQLTVWRDSDTLWSRVVSVEPCAMALTNQGAAFSKEGDTLGAMACYRRAVAMDPGYAYAHYDLGLIFLDLHRYDEAIQECRVAKRLQPDLAGAYDAIGSALRYQGKLDEAIVAYRQAIQVDPKYATAKKNLESALRFKESQAP